MTLSLHELLAARRQPRATSTAPRQGFCPHHSQSVPRPERLAAQAEPAAASRPVTTMMLRNIPNKYTQSSLLQEIDDLGFINTYDFFYLPMDMHNRSNVGYAFINFVTAQHAERFRRAFSDHRFQRFQSRKISSVCSAHVQGLRENLRHFKNRAVTHARNDQYRPIVLLGSQRVEFEDAIAGLEQQGAWSVEEMALPGAAMGASAAGNPVAPRACNSGGTWGAARTLAPAAESFKGARQGLEEALRAALRTTFDSLELEPPQGGGAVGPLGALDRGPAWAALERPLAGGASAVGGSEVARLGVAAPAAFAWDGPAYVSPAPPKCPGPAWDVLGLTPRTNALILGSALGKLASDEPRCLL